MTHSLIDIARAKPPLRPISQIDPKSLESVGKLINEAEKGSRKAMLIASADMLQISVKQLENWLYRRRTAK